MSIQDDLAEIPAQETVIQQSSDMPDSGEELPRHLELMVGLEQFFTGLPDEKIQFMRSLLQEFPSIASVIAQELQMSTEQMDDFFGSLLGEERNTPTVREQQAQMTSPAIPQQEQMTPPVEQPVNEVDRMLQEGRGEGQPLV